MFNIDSSLSFSSDLVTGSALAHKGRATKPWKASNEGDSLFRLFPSVTLTVIFKEL